MSLGMMLLLFLVAVIGLLITIGVVADRRDKTSAKADYSTKQRALADTRAKSAKYEPPARGDHGGG